MCMCTNFQVCWPVQSLCQFFSVSTRLMAIGLFSLFLCASDSRWYWFRRQNSNTVLDQWQKKWQGMYIKKSKRHQTKQKKSNETGLLNRSPDYFKPKSSYCLVKKNEVTLSVSHSQIHLDSSWAFTVISRSRVAYGDM